MQSSASSAPGAADRSARGPWLSVVVPVFDEEESLPELYRRLGAVLDLLAEPSEIVFVNDGSTDRSSDFLDEIRKSDPRVAVAVVVYNAVQSSGVRAGCQVSRGDGVVTLDADLQTRPEEIPKLLDKIRDGFEVVGGVRHRRNDALARKALSGLVRAFSNGATDYGCMLRAYRRGVVQRVLRCPGRSLFVPALAVTRPRRVT